MRAATIIRIALALALAVPSGNAGTGNAFQTDYRLDATKRTVHKCRGVLAAE